MISHKIAVTGIVQGIGFRPFIYNLAQRLQLTGNVCNSAHGLEIVIQGAPEQVARFEKTVRETPPLHSRIDYFQCDETIPNP
ncbi:MAG: acylphosphatase, partial [Candidatus Neomarinimicrobiota bacterium]